MTQDEKAFGPGQATAPAFPIRDFDGGLVDRLTYELTPADAHASLRATDQMARRTKIIAGVVFLASGALVELAWPKGFAGQSESVILLAVVAVELALAGLGRWIWWRYRARRLIPRPRSYVFEEWIDCIAGTLIEDCEDIYLSHELIGPIAQSRDHIFVFSGSQAIVIPTRALDDPTAFTDHLRDLAKGPYYFDS